MPDKSIRQRTIKIGVYSLGFLLFLEIVLRGLFSILGAAGWQTSIGSQQEASRNFCSNGRDCQRLNYCVYKRTVQWHCLI